MEYGDLTPEQYAAGIKFLRSWHGPLSFGNLQDDETWLSLNNPNAELQQGFEAALLDQA